MGELSAAGLVSQVVCSILVQRANEFGESQGKATIGWENNLSTFAGQSLPCGLQNTSVTSFRCGVGSGSPSASPPKFGKAGSLLLSYDRNCAGIHLPLLRVQGKSYDPGPRCFPAHLAVLNSTASSISLLRFSCACTSLQGDIIHLFDLHSVSVEALIATELLVSSRGIRQAIHLRCAVFMKAHNGHTYSLER